MNTIIYIDKCYVVVWAVLALLSFASTAHGEVKLEEFLGVWIEEGDGGFLESFEVKDDGSMAAHVYSQSWARLRTIKMKYVKTSNTLKIEPHKNDIYRLDLVMTDNGLKLKKERLGKSSFTFYTALRKINKLPTSVVIPGKISTSNEFSVYPKGKAIKADGKIKVTIVGSIVFPGQYYIKKCTTLKEITDFASLLPSSTGFVTIYYEDEGIIKYESNRISSKHDRTIQPGELIFVHSRTHL